MNDNSPAYTTEYIADSAHYEKVIARVAGVKRQLWIGTADIKDLYVAQGRQTVPFLAIIAGLIKKGVEIRLIHAKEPGQAFREDFDRYPELATGLERILCPRVLYRLGQSHRCRHRHEKPSAPELRGRHPHRRPRARGSRRQPVRQRMDGLALP